MSAFVETLRQIPAPLDRIKDKLDAWSYEEARSEGARAFLPAVSHLDSLLSQPNGVRQDVAKMVALGLLAERVSADAAFASGRAAPWPAIDTQSWLEAAGIPPEYTDGLDARVTHALETTLFQGRQTLGRLDEDASVFPLGDFSERALGFLFQRAYDNAKGALLSPKRRDQRLALEIETALSPTLGNHQAALPAIERAAELLQPLIGAERRPPLFTRHGAEATVLSSLYRGFPLEERLTLLADPKMKVRINGGALESVPIVAARVQEELGVMFTWAGAEGAWNALDEEGRRTLVFLASHVDAPLADRVRILLENPGFLATLRDLSPEVQEYFAPIAREAALIAGMVSQTADVYALTKLKLPGWAQKAGRDFINFFSVPGSDLQPDGPRRPRWGRVGVIGLTIAAVVAGYIGVQDQQDNPPPAVGFTPGPDASPSPDLETSIAPLSPDASPVAIVAPPTALMDSPWVLSDFSKWAPLQPLLGSGIDEEMHKRILDGLTEVAREDMHCQINECGIQVANYDGRIAFALQAKGVLYAGFVNPDGSLNRAESEWVPMLKTVSGEQLTWGWFWDFTFDPETGEPVPTVEGKGFSRLGAWDHDGNVLMLHHSPFGDGATQLLVKDPARLFGTAFPHVEGREFMLIVDAKGEMTGGYYQYGTDGNVLLTVPSEDAKGKFGKWRIQDIDGAWKWEWLAASIATAPAPPPTEAPPATATPEQTNALIYGCKDEVRAQEVLSTFQASHPGFDFDSISVPEARFSISGGEWITVNHDGTLIGEYAMDLSGKDVAGYRAGANSYARCMVVMIPGISDPISIIDRLFVDGQQMNILLLDRRLVDNTKVDNFINSNIGKVIRFDIIVADKYAQKPSTQPPYSSINLDWYNNLFIQLDSIGPINSPVDEGLVKNLIEFYNNTRGLLTRNLTVAK